MTDEFSFEGGLGEDYEDGRLEELLDKLELQEVGAYESPLYQQQLEGTTCPGPIAETVSNFSQYRSSVEALPPPERAKLKPLADMIVASFTAGCPQIRVRLVGHADRDLAKERSQPGFLMS